MATVTKEELDAQIAESASKAAKKAIKQYKKSQAKKAKDKKQDAIRLFAEAGIPDPVSFWDDFQSTQV